MNNSTAAELEQLLEQAAAFARGGDYTGAFARARWAYEQLQRRAEQECDDPALEELLRVAEQKLPEYERLLGQWQEENARRHAAYVSREVRAIHTFAREDEPSRIKRRPAPRHALLSPRRTLGE